VFTADRDGLRAKDVCLARGIGTEPKDTEGIRAKLKRLVNRQILAESQPGLFTLSPNRTQPHGPPSHWTFDSLWCRVLPFHVSVVAA
jgi:hypothetical protein